MMFENYLQFSWVLCKFRRVSLSGYNVHQEPDLPRDFGRGQGEDKTSETTSGIVMRGQDPKNNLR
jgi:hypothetical protein